MNILDTYVKHAPSPQHALDLFINEWSSAMPAGLGILTMPGTAQLFDDPRIAWADARLGFAGRNIVELGPLEGGHSYMMQKRGAASITAIEANSRAYLKCLIVKEVFGLDKVSFKLGDFDAYFATNPPRADICIASGVLYHSVDPVRLLSFLADFTDKLFLWTHYYDEEILRNRPTLNKYFEPSESLLIEGTYFAAANKRYESALAWQGFCGGPATHAKWLSREAIIHFLKSAGFTTIDISFDHPMHANGPAFAICAAR
jgi:hypothetical protein